MSTTFDPDTAHTITLEEAPDLHDLHDLILYCREHDIRLNFTARGGRRGTFSPMIVSVWCAETPHAPFTVVEGEALPEAFFLTPDGHVWDANGDPVWPRA